MLKKLINPWKITKLFNYLVIPNIYFLSTINIDNGVKLIKNNQIFGMNTQSIIGIIKNGYISCIIINRISLS